MIRKMLYHNVNLLINLFQPLLIAFLLLNIIFKLYQIHILKSLILGHAELDSASLKTMNQVKCV